MLHQQIQNYKITREIGSGGMATVYETIHTKLDTKVAIKVLNPVLATNDNIRKRFMQEAKIMATLNHEGITKVIDFDETESRLAIVMEYLDGQTLDELIKKKGALSEKEALEIFIPILEAFEYAHNKGIVHRDVKPSNIFITKEGKVKIMDFGIAKLVEEGAKLLTQTGTQMGTPVYMSPEQVHDAKYIDKQTDIYSLGVVLWALLSGKPPYDGETSSTFAIYQKIDSETLDKVPDLSEKLNEAIQKATKKEKDKRLKDCSSFIKVLQSNIATNEETIIQEIKTKQVEEIRGNNKLITERAKSENNTMKTLSILSIIFSVVFFLWYYLFVTSDGISAEEFAPVGIVFGLWSIAFSAISTYKLIPERAKSENNTMKTLSILSIIFSIVFFLWYLLFLVPRAAISTSEFAPVGIVFGLWFIAFSIISTLNSLRKIKYNRLAK